MLQVLTLIFLLLKLKSPTFLPGSGLGVGTLALNHCVV